MMSYWLQLKPRERLMVTFAGGVLGVLLLYLLVLEPFTLKAEALSVKVEQQQSLVSWLNNTSAEINQLKSAQTSKNNKGRRGQSLLVLVDRTSKQSKLEKSIGRIEPDGSARVRVWLESAKFDDLINWFIKLEKNYQIIIESVVIDKTDVSGRVNVRLVFIEGGA